MKILYFKPSLALLLHSLVVITFFMPSLSFAYGGRHHGYNGYYGNHYYGYSGHYRYQKYGGHSYYPYNYNRRHHYNYPSRSYQYYLKSYSLTVPTYTLLIHEGGRNQQSSTQNVGINSSAWQTLGQGQYRAAFNIFAGEAQSHPNSGVPKVGYALATAFRGDLIRGIWAMRRAFRIDPDTLHYLQLDEKGHLLINNLIGQYSSQEHDANVDQAFMVSALYFLQHDYAAAKKSIASAQQYGDKSSSFTNLQRLIDQQLSGMENVN